MTTISTQAMPSAPQPRYAAATDTPAATSRERIALWTGLVLASLVVWGVIITGIAALVGVI